jgi:BED zinc finger
VFVAHFRTTSASTSTTTGTTSTSQPLTVPSQSAPAVLSLDDSGSTDSVDPSGLTKLKLVKKANSTSAIWNYFGFMTDKNGYPIDNGKPQCRTCFQEVSCKFGNTSNLYKHLKDNHVALHNRAKVLADFYCRIISLKLSYLNKTYNIARNILWV